MRCCWRSQRRWTVNLYNFKVKCRHRESGESGESEVGTPGGGVAHRGRLLESDADAAARGVFDGLFVLVVELVVP